MKLFSTSFFTQLSVKTSFIALFFVSFINAQTLTTDTYTASTTWVVPACVTSVTVRVWGAGGAGGGAGSTDRNGGGGGGGAYCTRVETVTPGETLVITVGAGGTGVSNANGNPGGFSQVAHQVGPVVFCRAAGGAGGTRGGGVLSPGAGGAGGTIANNIPAGTGFRGGNGGASIPDASSSDIGGGGGGGAGSGGNGGDGNPLGVSTPGLGTATGGGNGGAGGSGNTNPAALGGVGNVIGGGGGGSSAWNTSRAGGAGARGQVTITYTATGCEPPASTFAYTPAGSYNWVVPICVNFVTVEVWGAGGGSGGNIAALNNGDEICTGAGGGGGGGYAARTYAVVPGQSYTIVVGAGGTAGPAGVGGTGGITTPAGNGGTGGNSTFSGPATIGPGTLTGSGGTGGFGAGGRNNTSSTCFLANGAAGTGGSGLNGTINYTGGNGAPGYILSYSTDKSGGGGGAAGPGGNGGTAPPGSSVGVAVPPGGIGDAPGGNGGTGRMWNTPGVSAQNGTNGNAIGGGAGGSLIHRTGFGSTTAVGGVGGIGEVRLTYNTTCPLPIELMHFGGENKGEFNELVWITATERVNDYFTLDRSLNGVDWEKVTVIKGAGTTQETQNYSFDDRGYTRGVVNYYRLSQTDTDGTQEHVGSIIPINNRFSHLKVVSRYNAMGQEVGADAKGVVITLYEDGTTERVYVD